MLFSYAYFPQPVKLAKILHKVCVYNVEVLVLINMFLTRIRLVNKLPYCASSFIQYLFFMNKRRRLTHFVHVEETPFNRWKNFMLKKKKYRWLLLNIIILSEKNKTHLDKHNVYNNDNNKIDIVDWQ